MIKCGTYRICDYVDDGQYDIHWVCCDTHLRMCEWEAERFKFCPFCGKGDVKKLDCRRRNIPRWAYDMHSAYFGMDDAAYKANVQANRLFKQATRWVVEERTCARSEWRDWKHGMSEFSNAKDALERIRLKIDMADADRSPYDSIAYRLRLVTGEYKTCTTEKVLERPEWVRDDVGDCAAANSISREEAYDRLVREAFDKSFEEDQD